MSFSTSFSNFNPFNGTSPDSIGIPSQFLNIDGGDDDGSDLFGSAGIGGGFDLPTVASGEGIGSNNRAEMFKRILDKINSRPSAEVVETVNNIKYRQPIPAAELPATAAQVYEAASVLLDDLKKTDYKDQVKLNRLQELLTAQSDLVQEYGSTDSLVWLALIYEEIPSNTANYTYLQSLFMEWGATDQFALNGKAASQPELSGEERKKVTRVLQDQLRVTMTSFGEHEGALALSDSFLNSEYMAEAEAYMDTFRQDAPESPNEVPNQPTA